MLPARHRLRRTADFASALRGRGHSRAAGRLVVVHAARPQTRAGQPPRAGFVVSKAVGGAVARNRTKRVLRHLLAARLDGIPQGCDLVVRAQAAAAQATTPELAAELDRLLPRVLRGRA